MKEFIEKLIGRLEEEREKHISEYGLIDMQVQEVFVNMRKIINELAEEYINTSIDTSTNSVDTSSGWISVLERLPDEYDYPEQRYRVLASCTDGIVRNTTIKSLRENKVVYCLSEPFYYTAWMPLPQPYTVPSTKQLTWKQKTMNRFERVE